MRIINIVDRLDRVNFGIWNAAISTSRELKENHSVESEIWYPSSTSEVVKEALNGAIPRGLDNLATKHLRDITSMAGLNPAKDVIVSHGCWQFPTRWGRHLKNLGFSWVAVPQGMLEPWSRSQKRLLKWGYFNLFEKRALQRADVIRAVSKPEYANLQKVFQNRMEWIPNGVVETDWSETADERSPVTTFLFMARLHQKKGIMPLLEGWKASSLSRSSSVFLKIAGPDDGEFSKLEQFLIGNPGIGNVEYIGPVFGEEKANLLKSCHFYVLPSYSEGFPSSVLEAMQSGMVPIVSQGCNFPDIFESKIGIHVEPDSLSIKTGLEAAKGLGRSQWEELSRKACELVQSAYTCEKVASKQFGLYSSLLESDHA
ncbi:MAG: glycosyltransferase [Puniceicoccaceae bacterium]